MKILTLLCLLFLSCTLCAQNLATIKGTVLDKAGLPLPGATVLLSGYKIATVANSEGKFVFTEIKPGTYDILVQIIGYVAADKNVAVATAPVEIEFRLNEIVNNLKEVNITARSRKQKWLNTFKKCFIGTSANARRCKIVNPQVLQFHYDPETEILTAKADEFLIVDNMALGYRINYLLKYFEIDLKQDIVFFFGYPSFSDIKASASQEKRFAENRKQAYRGSPEHFFSSLYHNTYQEEGYIINTLVKKPNLKKRPDSVMDSQIRYYADKAARRSSWKYSDSLDYWTNLKNAPDTLEVLDRRPVVVKDAVKAKTPTLKTLLLNGAAYVVYTGEKETKNYDFEQTFKVVRPDDYAKYQISVIYHPSQGIDFRENGNIENQASVAFEGHWSYEKVADMVPLDYAVK